MKPQIKLAETLTPDGRCLALFEHDGAFSIRLDGQGLMDSLATHSEVMLGELAVAELGPGRAARILIGGLGLGFTLRSVLDRAGVAAEVSVVELIPAVVDWNRGFLLSVNGTLLSDPRVRVVVRDVWDEIALAASGQYDSIVLDVDNGPEAMVHARNARLYGLSGLQRIFTVLRSDGRAVIWSAGGEDRVFSRRLAKAGFCVSVVRAKRHSNARRYSHTIYVADKAHNR